MTVCFLKILFFFFFPLKIFSQCFLLFSYHGFLNNPTLLSSLEAKPLYATQIHQSIMRCFLPCFRSSKRRNQLRSKDATPTQVSSFCSSSLSLCLHYLNFKFLKNYHRPMLGKELLNLLLDRRLVLKNSSIA